ncbi:hypothetical protein CSUI_000173, partial [Cystoisospora suis]
RLADVAVQGRLIVTLRSLPSVDTNYKAQKRSKLLRRVFGSTRSTLSDVLRRSDAALQGMHVPRTPRETACTSGDRGCEKLLRRET